MIVIHATRKQNHLGAFIYCMLVQTVSSTIAATIQTFKLKLLIKTLIITCVSYLYITR